MSKVSQKSTAVKIPFSIQFFDKTGMETKGENQVVLFTKITTSAHEIQWDLLYMN